MSQRARERGSASTSARGKEGRGEGRGRGRGREEREREREGGSARLKDWERCVEKRMGRGGIRVSSVRGEIVLTITGSNKIHSPSDHMSMGCA